MGDVMTSESQPRPPTALERGPGGESAVLVMDGGEREGVLSGLWPELSHEVQVAWVSLSAVDDPLVHARAMFERQVDAGRITYLVTSVKLAQTAMLVAAHRAEAVGAVFVVADERAGLEGELRDMLGDNDVPVRTVAPGRDTADVHSEHSSGADLVEALLRRLLEQVPAASDANKANDIGGKESPFAGTDAVLAYARAQAGSPRG